MIPALFAAALLGLATTVYLLWKRYARPGEPLVCPIGENCQTVLDSRFGRMLGFRNEFIGAAYYAVMLAFLILAEQGKVLPFSLLGSADPADVALLIAVPAAVVSIALTGIQALVLKNWCSYCLFANAVNIFLLVGILVSR
ncbi:MAG: vitamin K epoxide reductase family protein [bacterium]|nr:vitamin K epoxide reductase family protein [bacterium]